MKRDLSIHFNKENPHHAYLLEGRREEVLSEVYAFLEELGVPISGNPDLYSIALDSFKVEDARNLKSFESERSFSADKNAKRVFIIATNSFLLEAQNTLLKMFEEPIESTHFFLIVPDSNILLKTLVSRFYLIKKDDEESQGLQEAENFISSSPRTRIEFLKEFLTESGDDEDTTKESTRSRALKFLDNVEVVLHKKLDGASTSKNFTVSYYKNIFKAREFLRQPGSSAKSLMESVALSIPNF